MAQRTDHAVQVDVHKDYQAPAPQANPNVVVPVHVLKTEKMGAQFGVYTTFVIQPGSANAIMVMPEDPDRERAVVLNAAQTTGAHSPFVVLCNTQSAAQAPGNISGTTGLPPATPAGYLLACGEDLETKNRSMLWAVNSDPSAVAYVSVVMERTNP